MLGCTGTHHLLIIDPAGRPVVGVEVYSVAASMETGPHLSDSDGRVSVPYNVQGTQYLRVTKAGFDSIDVPVSPTWPTSVTLQPMRVPRR